MTLNGVLLSEVAEFYSIKCFWRALSCHAHTQSPPFSPLRPISPTLFISSSLSSSHTLSLFMCSFSLTHLFPVFRPAPFSLLPFFTPFSLIPSLLSYSPPFPPFLSLQSHLSSAPFCSTSSYSSSFLSLPFFSFLQSLLPATLSPSSTPLP